MIDSATIELPAMISPADAASEAQPAASRCPLPATGWLDARAESNQEAGQLCRWLDGKRFSGAQDAQLMACDLFCGGGGASWGLQRAGFAVMGVDIAHQPDYPFEIWYGDALEADIAGFDFVWASPPCQAHSCLRHRTGKTYESYIEPVREKLEAWGGPYIIENVMGAPLRSPIKLCGSAFGLGVWRHRIFESNVPLQTLPCNHEAVPQPVDVSGTGAAQRSPRKKRTGGLGRKPEDLEHARSVMAMPWASRRTISQAIPPAYSEYLGRQILKAIAAADAGVQPQRAGRANAKL